VVTVGGQGLPPSLHTQPVKPIHNRPSLSRPPQVDLADPNAPSYERFSPPAGTMMNEPLFVPKAPHPLDSSSGCAGPGGAVRG
jgi:hypothetical protein